MDSLLQGHREPCCVLRAALTHKPEVKGKAEISWDHPPQPVKEGSLEPPMAPHSTRLSGDPGS
jgi:hypothetical protein